jgi:hypothetical protein
MSFRLVPLSWFQSGGAHSAPALVLVLPLAGAHLRDGPVLPPIVQPQSDKVGVAQGLNERVPAPPRLQVGHQPLLAAATRAASWRSGIR